MTTASTSTVVDHSTDAAFRTWVAEIIAQFAVVGLAITADTGQINTSTVTRPGANTAGGYSIFRFTDTLAKGPLATMNAIVGGAAYTNGTYTNVPLTGGTGSGGQATIVVAGGVVTTVTITAGGTNYLACDQLSAAAANIGGTGSGFTAQVATLTAAAFPIVIKLEYGTGAATTQPQLWVTVGQGTNGAGTITGSNQSTRAAMNGTSTIASTVTSYTSRFCFNATAGFLGFAWKTGAASANTTLGGLMLFRSSDATGAASSDAYALMVNSFSTTAQSSNGGAVQNCSFLTNTNYPPAPSQASASDWAAVGNTTGAPYNLTATTFAGNTFVIPVYYMTPNICITPWLCVALISEIPAGNSFTTTIVGASSHTYLSLGLAMGNASSLGNISGGSTMTLCMLWE